MAATGGVDRLRRGRAGDHRHRGRVSPIVVATARPIFEADLWALPTQIYSRPQVLYPGQTIEKTDLDTHLQSIAEAAVGRGLEKLEKARPRLKRKDGGPLEAAMVVLEPSTGEILTLVGGRDFSRNQFDHALLAHRQAGSLFKPFVYLAGFERAERDLEFQFTPATLLEDAPIDLVSGTDHWSPQNYDEEFRGPLTLRRALEESLNVPAVRASWAIGLTEIADVAKSCGIPLPSTVYPSLALGAEQVTPMQMAQAYSVIAAGGQSIEPVGVREDLSREGTVLYEASAPPRPVVSETSAYLTLDLLRGFLDRGTARRSRGSGIVGDFAGKTGTTNENRDAWFIGFSSDLLAIVWVGFDDNTEMGLTGADGALPIWIDARNGALTTEHCPEALEEVFVLGTEPVEPCPEHGSGEESIDWFLTASRLASQRLRAWDDGNRLIEFSGASLQGDDDGWATTVPRR